MSGDREKSLEAMKEDLKKESPFSDEIEEELLDILSNGSDEIFSAEQEHAYKFVTSRILWAKHYYHDWKSPVSARRRDRLNKLSAQAESLSRMISEEDFGDLAERERERLRRLAKYAESVSHTADPEKHRSHQNYAHHVLANAIVDAIVIGYLDIPLRKNKDSQLARLFRICCRAADLDVPKAGHNYLSEPVDRAAFELELIESGRWREFDEEPEKADRAFEDLKAKMDKMRSAYTDLRDSD